MAKTLQELQEKIEAADKLLTSYTKIKVQSGRIGSGQQFEITQITPTANGDGPVDLTLFVRPVNAEDDDE